METRFNGLFEAINQGVNYVLAFDRIYNELRNNSDLRRRHCLRRGSVAVMSITKVQSGVARGATLNAMRFAASIRLGRVNAKMRNAVYNAAKDLKMEAKQFGKRKPVKHVPRVVVRRLGALAHR